MATLLAQAKRLTYWLMGTPDDTPPPVPIPRAITPLLDHVAFYMNIHGRIPPEMTKEEIMDKLNTYVTDAQLQAHVMAFLRDYHHMTFDPALNPRAPKPQYYSTRRRTRRGSTSSASPSPERRGVYTTVHTPGRGSIITPGGGSTPGGWKSAAAGITAAGITAGAGTAGAAGVNDDIRKKYEKKYHSPPDVLSADQSIAASPRYSPGHQPQQQQQQAAKTAAAAGGGGGGGAGGEGTTTPAEAGPGAGAGAGAAAGAGGTKGGKKGEGGAAAETGTPAAAGAAGAEQAAGGAEKQPAADGGSTKEEGKQEKKTTDQ